MSMNFIDPYGLLGATIDSTPTQVKQAYYALSRMVHPDKGGNAEDMIVVHNAYKYVMAQVTQVNRSVSVEDLEERFASFCREQVDAAEAPSFRTLCMDADGADYRMADLTVSHIDARMEGFHRAFEAVSRAEAEAEADAPPDTHMFSRASLSSGYAPQMEQSQYHGAEPREVAPIEYDPFLPSPLASQAAANAVCSSSCQPVGVGPFTVEIVAHTEPSTLMAGTSMNFTDLQMVCGRVDHGSSRDPSFGMTDYSIAFSTVGEILQEVSPHLLFQTFEQVSMARDYALLSY